VLVSGRHGCHTSEWATPSPLILSLAPSTPFLGVPILHLPYTLHAASMLQALHVAAGALGASVLAAKLLRCQSVGFVAGAAYMVYGGFYSNAEHPDIVRAFSLLPWLFLGVPAGAR